MAQPRFIDNGNGTVTDNLTGLIWLKNANCFNKRNWLDALSAAKGLAGSSCGLIDGSKAGDWRLPDMNEMKGLIDFSKVFQLLPSGHSFTAVQTAFPYWSSAQDVSWGAATLWSSS
ncbi:MAG: DUF1566 domain-containing protein [Deltaproteobacteria bacterium]|nr:DUF1566 domain-containing protein [Deltaproteobacteria bacterium]